MRSVDFCKQSIKPRSGFIDVVNLQVAFLALQAAFLILKVMFLAHQVEFFVLISLNPQLLLLDDHLKDETTQFDDICVAVTHNKNV